METYPQIRPYVFIRSACALKKPCARVENPHISIKEHSMQNIQVTHVDRFILEIEKFHFIYNNQI